MARRSQSSWDKNVWSNVEAWQTVAVTGGAAASAQTAIARIDGGAGRLECSSAGTLISRQNVIATNQNTLAFLRIYLYIATPVASSSIIMQILTVTNVNLSAVQLNTDNSLSLLKADGTQLGSNSSALPSATWVRIELKHDATTNPGALEARYAICNGSGVDPGNGTETTFASGANSSQGSWGRFLIGSLTSTTCDLYFDDVALNDSTGSFQTSWPGNGHIVVSVPSAAGDSNQWLDTAGAAGTANNYTLVDEVTSNNTTDYVQSNTLDALDFYNVNNFGLSASDTINVVEMVYRYGNTPVNDASTQRARPNYMEFGWYREIVVDPPLPSVITWDQYKVGTTFDAVDPRG